jgi:hypothetical protein
MEKRPQAWIVNFDSDAVIDFEDVRSRGDRKAVSAHDTRRTP